MVVSVGNVGDPGSIPGLGRSPGEGNRNPLQYSCLESFMDGGAWKATVHGITRNQKGVSNITSTFHFPLSCIGKENDNPLKFSCLENPRDGGAWWAAVYGVAQSQTRLSDFTLYSVREFSNFILLHIADQFSQHRLLKRLSFLLYILASFIKHKVSIGARVYLGFLSCSIGLYFQFCTSTLLA